MHYKKTKQGVSTMEVVVSLGVFVVVVTGVAGLYTDAINGTAEINQKFQADMLLQQGFEAVRAIRDYTEGDSDPECEYEAATVWVDENGIIVGGPDNGETYSGTLRGNWSVDDIIVGTPGVDIIYGKSGNDTICGLDGDDEIDGNSGNDTIIGGSGNDKIWGGSGDDLIIDMAGDNELRGENGDDTFYSGGGMDTITGGEGFDTIYSGAGDDTVYGYYSSYDSDDCDDDDDDECDDSNLICSGEGNDYVKGGNDDDSIDAGEGIDTIRGKEKFDICLNGEDNSRCEQETGEIPECGDVYTGNGYVMTYKKGLSKENGYWEYFGESDVVGEFTRTIEVEDVLRDENCTIVESGGTPDPDTKKLIITIDWDQEETVPRTISSTKYFHNWADPVRCTDEAEDFLLDISQAYLGVNNKKLIDIYLENKGTLDVTIDKITLSWTNDSHTEWIVIEQDKVWQYHGGIGSPPDRQESGSEVDIVDHVIPGFETHNLKEIKFEDPVGGNTFNLTVTLIDGSSVSAFIDPN